MILRDINDKRIMHIDTSGKLYEKRVTGIAYKITSSGLHSGLALSTKLKKELRRDLSVHKDYSKLYAICIYHLIKDKLSLFDILVICDDEPFKKVSKYLKLLFLDNKELSNKEILSIGDLRKITNDKKICSFADGIANSYRRRALRTKARQQKGNSLNVVRLSYELINTKWNELKGKNNKI